MPLFDYICTECSHTTEELFSVHEEKPTSIECEKCGKDAIFIFPMIARTSGRWGDSNAHFDSGLGTYVENSMHKEQILKERGLVSESDMGSHWHEDRAEGIKDADKKEEQLYNTYNANIKKNHGDTMQASIETFPAHDIIEGKFDD